MSDPTKPENGLELENLGSEAAGATTTSPRMLVPLFLVPLVIVAVVVAIFLAVGSFLGTEKSVADWVNEVETGGANGSWQAVSALTDLAIRSPEKLADPVLRGRLREIWQRKGNMDSRLRQWLATTWERIGDAEAAPLLAEGLKHAREALDAPGGREGPNAEPASSEVIKDLRALAVIGAGAVVEQVAPSVRDPDRGIRMAAADALGVIGRKLVVAKSEVPAAVTEPLVALHGDAEAWVRINAALALAKCGRWEGLPTLEAMLDRGWLKEQKLQFPDDGRVTVTSFDPAVEPIAAAMLAIGALLDARSAANGPESRDLAPLRAALTKAASDANPALKQRANDLLKKLGG